MTFMVVVVGVFVMMVVLVCSVVLFAAVVCWVALDAEENVEESAWLSGDSTSNDLVRSV